MLLEQRKSIPGGVDLSYSGKPTAEVHQCSFVVAVAFKCCQNGPRFAHCPTRVFTGR